MKTVIEKLSEDTIQERKKNKVEADKKADELNAIIKVENEQLRYKIMELHDKYSVEYKNKQLLEENYDQLSKRFEDITKEFNKKDKKINELSQDYNKITDKFNNLANEFKKEKIEIETNFKLSLNQKEDEMQFIKTDFENKLKRAKQNHQEELNKIS